MYRNCLASALSVRWALSFWGPIHGSVLSAVSEISMAIRTSPVACNASRTIMAMAREIVADSSVMSE